MRFMITSPNIESPSSGDDLTPVFAKQDVAELFERALELRENDPEGAYFLYQQVAESDPTFMGNRIREFVQRESERLHPARIQQYLRLAQEAYRNADWRLVDQYATDTLKLDAENQEAQNLKTKIEANLPCEPIYQQARAAAEKGKWRAVKTLMEDVRQTYPHYSDPDALYARSLLEWVDIPAGETSIEDYTLEVKPFKILRFPLTNVQFQAFIDAGGYSTERYWDNLAKRFDSAQASSWPGSDFPKVRVSWYEAIAFTRWLSEKSKISITLPTEQEWQWAAVGATGWQYPYGNTFDSNKCNIQLNRTPQQPPKGTTPVNQYAGKNKGDSPFGVSDMSGNVWEWCLNSYEHPSIIELESETQRTIRGGSYNSSQGEMIATTRTGYDAFRRTTNIGFRLVMHSSTT
jgi:formylglycine-generating enzyme required for sulfatase activity